MVKLARGLMKVIDKDKAYESVFFFTSLCREFLKNNKRYTLKHLQFLAKIFCIGRVKSKVRVVSKEDWELFIELIENRTLTKKGRPRLPHTNN